MAKELDPDVIKTTQISLGKYIKKPLLTEKLLKKPPFRFLHDIITTVIKTTGFFEGLFEEEQLISENVKDRESKILFLNKVVTVLRITTGTELNVKPSKIVAGQEPEKTNELLQCLAQALDQKLSSADAIKSFKEESKLPQTDDSKVKKIVQSSKKTSNVKTLTSRSEEKSTKQSETSSSKNQKTRPTDKSKSKIKDSNTTHKKQSPPKKLTQLSSSEPKIISVKNVTEEQSEDSNENKVISEKNYDKDSSSNYKKTKEDKKQQNSSHNTENFVDLDQSVQSNLNTSYTIIENDLNLSLSSRDLLEVKNYESEDLSYNSQSVDITHTKHVDDKESTKLEKERNENTESTDVNETNSNEGIVYDSVAKDFDKDIAIKIQNKADHEINRPPSVRPSSSRPGAPRLREKHDSTLATTDHLLLGKVNIIAENASNEEEEEISIIIENQQVAPVAVPLQDQQDQMHLSSNQESHLVQQILDSQKEFSQISGKTEIEWQFGAQKAREEYNKEVDMLRFNIQTLSRVANPLGKLLDHIQEDVEVMRQELQQWNTTYEETFKELVKQKLENDESLLPLRTKLKKLVSYINEKHEKINDLKMIVHKNASRIEKLLASGNMT